MNFWRKVGWVMFNSPNLTDAFFSPESGDKPEITEVALKKLVPYENQPFNLYLKCQKGNVPCRLLFVG